VSEQVNRKEVPLRNTILQLSTPNTDHPLKLPIYWTTDVCDIWTFKIYCRKANRQ